MNIARNTKDIPINGIFANKSMRAMSPTSIDRMTVVPVNTFRRCGGGEMEVRAVPVGGDAVEQQVYHRVGLLLEHPVANAVQVFPYGIRGRRSDRTATLCGTIGTSPSPRTNIVGTVILSSIRLFQL